MLLRRLAPLLAVALVFAASARADADPPSDILYTQRIYLPFFGTKVDKTHADALKQVVDNAWKKGYRIKVALVATTTDLGGVPDLFGKPQTYADFLGHELTFLYKGPLVTVMPQGLGFFHYQKPTAKEKRVVGAISPGEGANGLADAAVTAVTKLAHVPRPKQSGGSSSKSGSFDWTLIAIAAGGAAVLVSMMVLGPAAVRRRRTAS